MEQLDLLHENYSDPHFALFPLAHRFQSQEHVAPFMRMGAVKVSHLTGAKVAWVRRELMPTGLIGRLRVQ